ncbi:hypothetical protein RUM43_012041 [Polyplax serrata]|uniref:Uncharacterized protein n=1 Tax=Polyplax serrata TaxID=468196 RepID=A0AAN8PJ67_POLSC
MGLDRARGSVVSEPARPVGPAQTAAFLQVPDETTSEVLAHEGVDERIDAAVKKSHNVEDDPHFVNGLVERYEVELLKHVHGNTGSPTEIKENYDQDEHLDHLGNKNTSFVCLP